MTPPRAPASSRWAKLQPRFDQPANCRACTLYGTSKGYVPASGPEDAPLVLLGEAAWVDEIIRGEPFSGAAGAMLERVLARVQDIQPGLRRENLRIDNTLRCAPPLMDLSLLRGAQQAIATCRQYSDVTLAEPHAAVVPLGNTALKRVLGSSGRGIRVQDFHGTVSRAANGIWMIPTFHPSFLQRGATHLVQTMAFDLLKAWEVAGVVRAGGEWTGEPIETVIDPPVAWFAAWAQQYSAAATQSPDAVWIAIDIETLEKAGKDEGDLGPTDPEVLADRVRRDRSYTITRVNVSCHPDEGVTVPFVGEYIEIIRRICASPGVKVVWNEDYDIPRLLAAACPLRGTVWDLMWAWHILQSDLPRGLGFVAPFFSDYGPWKHLSGPQPAQYAALDGPQTLRCGYGIVRDLVAAGQWAVFERHVHQLKQVALQPAMEVGVLVDRVRLDTFEEALRRKATQQMQAIQDAVPEALQPRTPKSGYKKRPTATLHTRARTETSAGVPKVHQPDPMKAELYQQARVVKTLEIREVFCCATCGAEDILPRHACKDRIEEEPSLLPGGKTKRKRYKRVAVVALQPATVTRFYWQEPFNPDSVPQLLAYMKFRKHQPGKAKKTGKASTEREVLEKLAAATKDPVYRGILNYRGIAKVRGTYVIGTRRRMDKDDRTHPVPTFKPSTQRLSYQAPNIQNVVADKESKRNLAAGFRRCIVAGVARPAWLTGEDEGAWKETYAE
jgi:uracil-DNA glycosylase family 4